MALSNEQKSEIQAILQIILDATAPAPRNRRRRLADMFLDLVDREAWAEYYEVVPHPRCLHGVRDSLAKNEYNDPLQAYEDLNLVFLNALFYNEGTSQISRDAGTLKRMLDEEWRKRPLPHPPIALPAKSAQIRHNVPLPDHALASTSATPAAPALPAAPAQPAPPAPQATPAPSVVPETPAQQEASLPRETPALRTSALPRSPERPMTPDMDVEVGGTPEPETVAQDMALDGESDAIVQQLEKGLPRWEGFSDAGWVTDLPQERFLSIVEAISGYQDANGNRLASSLEAIPEGAEIPTIPFKDPLSLSLIENRVKDKYYQTSAAFDQDMERLFLKGRRWFEPASEAYSNVLLLQRMYQALVSPDPPQGPPYTSKTYFAALPAAPGTAKPLHSTDAEGVPGVTTYRVATKDRQFIDQVDYKGMSIKLADWVHLSNCDDPGRPIIGQVFRCWVSEEPAKKGRLGITVCWYFRPEQTFHPAQRQFWENEVFKTSHFADHPVEDFIEKVAVQFTARHIRGRPRPPFWYPGWPLYVCDSRYNDRERIFVKIKNWNSCVPEEVRKDPSYMPIYLFERPVFPRRFASPFVSGKPLKAPGGIGGAIERPEGEKLEGGGIGRKRAKKNTTAAGRAEMTDRVGQSKGVYVGPPMQAQSPGPAAYQYQNVQAPQYGRAPMGQNRPVVDRSILTAAGGAAVLGVSALTEKLPPETAKLFDRDPETNEVLWFAAPPVDIAHPPGPQYSLEYLNFLARKRRKLEQEANQMDVDSPAAEPASSTQAKAQVQPTVSEQVQSLLSTLDVPIP